MKKENTPENSIKKYSIMVIVFVISIVLIGVSVSYAYFSARFSGESNAPGAETAILNVTTTLTTTPAIDNAELAIIDASEYLTKSEKVFFTVTNETTSNIKGKYNVKIVNMSLSKNLFSKYFKWKLVVNEGTASEKEFTGTFADEAVASEGTEDNTEVTNLTKVLVTDEEALVLDIGQTDDMKFYIWLENDDNVNQLYLTKGSFSGKLSMDAVPTKE